MAGATNPLGMEYIGVLNGPFQFESARKIWPLLELLAKIRRVLACSWSRNFCKCSHALIFVKNILSCSVSTFCILETKTGTGNNVSRIGKWETLGKHVRAMNVLLMFIETDWPEISRR